MLVIGTAGHIDHGKSSVVRRLTGTDPDRLPEEKSRGMTIDLGFAFLDRPDSDTLAFVDVPGHERFVKNMIAGAGGIDVVMLVIAADDGWMPQSEEHFQITRLLGVRRGLIVINKVDLVEADWLELLEQDIRQKVANTFLSGAPIFRVSAATGRGFDQLVSYLLSLSDVDGGRRDIGKPRLYIDRSFVRPGMGPVVTGTLKEGAFQVGQTVGIWPGMRTAKIRTLQSNNRDVQRALPGQRTAISFTGLERDDLVRGGVITGQTDLAYHEQHRVLALSIEMLHDAAVSLADRRRVLGIIGTTEFEGGIRLYDNAEIRAGGKGILFIQPDQPVYSSVGDYCVLRLPTPMVTLGGGRVIDHLENLPRRKYYGDYQYLKVRETAGLDELLISEVQKQIMAEKATILEHAVFSRHEIAAHLQGLLAGKKLEEYGGKVFHADTMQRIAGDARRLVEQTLAEKSHLGGVTLEMLARGLRLSMKKAEAVVEYLVYQGVLTRTADTLNVAGEELVLKGEIKIAHDQIIAELSRTPLEPPAMNQLAAKGKAHRQAIKFIIDTGKAYKVGSSFLFLPEVWEEIDQFVRSHLKKDNTLMVGDLKDRFGFTRKFAIPILEEFDRLQITQRNGDTRVKGARFEE